MVRTGSGGGSGNEANEGAVGGSVRSVNQSLSLPLLPLFWRKTGERVVPASEGLAVWGSCGPLRLALQLLLWLMIPRGGVG